MVDPNTRQGKRTPVTLKIKFKSETLEQFIERYAVDVSQGGIFIRTKEPLAVGTQMRFEFQLRDASPLIAGEGTVVWTRENDPSRPAIAPGMGVRFDRLAEGSQTVLERILSEKAKQAPQRTNESPTKPPLFTDTPTKVAPLPVQDALLGTASAKHRASGDAFSDQGTPLPKPMPFHSDAEDFDEQAFEEATKVRALDELIAQTADGGDGATAIIPPDELAARRLAAGLRPDGAPEGAPLPPNQSGPIGAIKSGAIPTVSVEGESAPGLPNPPTTSPRLLDTTPSPRAVDAPQPDLNPAKTRLGYEAPRAGSPSSPPKSATATPAPAAVAKDAVTRPSGQQAVATPVPEASTKRPVAPAPKSSAAPVVILILVLLAAGAAGVWFFYLRPKAQEAAQVQVPEPGSASAVAPDLGSGSAPPPPEVGSGSDQGSAAAVVPPTGPIVETVIAASVDNAEVEVVGTDQKGPAPLTAKLEKDRDYKVRITSPGFAASELDVKGGQDKVTAKLVAKPRMIAVTTEPAGALIFVDGSATGNSTPHEVELTKAQSAKKSVRITLRKGGFRAVDKVIAADAYTEEDARLVAKIDTKLTVQQVVRPTPTPTPNAGSGSAEPGAGSATPTPTPPEPSTGSSAPAPTPTPTPTTPPAAGSAAAAKPPEPEPSFAQ